MTHPEPSADAALARRAAELGLDVATATLPDGPDHHIELTYLAVGDGPLALCLHGDPDSAWTRTRCTKCSAATATQC